MAKADELVNKLESVSPVMNPSTKGNENPIFVA